MGASITKYAYAVSGAHVYEKNYFRKSDMDKLLAAPSYEAVVAILQERGWTMPEDTRDSGKILDLELSRAWSWVQLSAPDRLPQPQGRHQVPAVGFRCGCAVL